MTWAASTMEYVGRVQRQSMLLCVSAPSRHIKKVCIDGRIIAVQYPDHRDVLFEMPGMKTNNIN